MPERVSGMRPKRWLAAAGMLMALCSGLAAIANAEDELAEGKILVADRKLRDPNFAKTVIYLITYDDQGAVGLILNRQSDKPVSELLRGVKEAQSRKDFAFSGGPVQLDSILALFRSRTRKQGAQHLSGEVYAILDENLLKQTLKTGAGPDVLRFYSGYAGWGPGQLDIEVDAGAWHVLSGDSKTVFDANPDSLWERLVRQAEGTLAANRGGLLNRAAAP